MTDVKPCTSCGQVKSLDDFHRQSRGKFGRHSWCKPCYNARHPKKKQLSPERRRELNYRSRYGFGVAVVASILERQGGACAICGIDLSGRKPYVDHDHATGRVRGILCLRCNIHLPFAEDAGWLEQAWAYLRREQNPCGS